MKHFSEWAALRHRFLVSARSTGVSRDDAEDIAQRLVERMFASRKPREPVARPEGYIFRMSTNEARSQHRSRSRRLRREVAYSSHAEYDDSPENQFLTEECALACARTFTQLVAIFPATTVQAFVLCDLHDISAGKAASLLGCPEGTIRTRIRRVRAFLRADLADALRLYGADTIRKALARTSMDTVSGRVA